MVIWLQPVEYLDPDYASICTIARAQTWSYNPAQLVINSYLQLKYHSWACAQERRVHKAAIILLKVITLTFENLFY